jgi:hypothetical protein
MLRDDDADDDSIRSQRVAAAPGGEVSTLEGVASAAVGPAGVEGCSEHLQHPLCRPCGDRCIGNPFCGPGKAWCRIEGGGEDCPLETKVVLNQAGCVGPYPGHESCETLIQADLANQQDEPEIVPAGSVTSMVVVRPTNSPSPSPSPATPTQDKLRARVKTLQRRCDAQERLYNQGSCPRPTEEQLQSARNPPDQGATIYARHCNAAPVHTLGSFLRHVIDGMGPQLETAAKAFERVEQEVEGELDKATGDRPSASNVTHSLAMLLVPKSQRHKVTGAPSPPADTSSDTRMRQASGSALGIGSDPVSPMSLEGVSGGDAHVSGSAPAGEGAGGGERMNGVPSEGVQLSSKVVEHADEQEGGGLVAWLLETWAGWLTGCVVLSGAVGAAWYSGFAGLGSCCAGLGPRGGGGAGRRGQRHRMPRSLWGAGNGAGEGSAGKRSQADEHDAHGIFEDGNHSTGLFEAFEDDDIANDGDDRARFRG